ncbi:MAG: ATP-dependent Clp protease proteolytic subunit [Firmicutes bacterium]|nr:ATP-dependent Clp protease proteolytic subunit [Bacillota bacterium]
MKDEERKNGSCPEEAGAEFEHSGDEVKQTVDDFGAIRNVFRFDTDIQYLTIIGSVEGHMVLPPQNKTTKYENIIPQLVAVEENPQVKGLLVILNTVGGDVEAGLALAEMISTLSKPTVSLVLGGGHSIGVPLATAADHSFIAESATMTLHPIRMSGLVIGAEQTYEYFRRMQDRIVDFIVRTSRADRDTILRLMSSTSEMANDVGTILYGREAVEIGLIDEMGGLKEALKKLKEMVGEEK